MKNAYCGVWGPRNTSEQHVSQMAQIPQTAICKKKKACDFFHRGLSKSLDDHKAMFGLEW